MGNNLKPWPCNRCMKSPKITREPSPQTPGFPYIYRCACENGDCDSSDFTEGRSYYEAVAAWNKNYKGAKPSDNLIQDSAGKWVFKN